MNPGLSGGYSGPGYAGTEPPYRINFGWVSEAWSLFSANAGVWIGATAMLLIPGGLAAIIYMVSIFSLIASTSGSSHAATMTGILVSIVGLLGMILAMMGAFFLTCGLEKMAVKQIKGGQIEFADVFRGGPFFWRALGLSLLVGLCTYIATLFLIIPGLILAALMLPTLALVSDGESVFPAIQRSMDAMKTDLLNAVLLYLLLSVIMYAGSLALGVGVLVTMPIYWLVRALIYRDMIGIPGVPRGLQLPRVPSPASWPPPNAYPPPANIWPPPPSQTPPATNVQEGPRE